MKKTIVLFLSVTIALLFSAASEAATASFVSKKGAGVGGNVTWTYKYVCSDGRKGTFSFDGSPNRSQADALAQQEANDICGEE